MKLKTKSGTIFDSEKYEPLHNFSNDDIIEILELYERNKELKKK